MSKIQILLELDKSSEIKNFNNSSLKTTHDISGWKVKPSVHSGSQALDRRPDHTQEDWKKMHTRVVDHIIKHNVPAGEHVFYSKSTRQGYVADVIHKSKKISIVTVLPPGHSRAGGDTGKHIIESIELETHFVE